MKQKPILNHIFKSTLLTICLLTGLFCYAQVSFPDQPSNHNLLVLEDQYRQQHYANVAQTARQFLSSVTHKVNPEQPVDIEYAKYYLTLSCIKTDFTGWEDSALNMIDETPTLAYRQRIAYTLAQHYFQKNKLSMAIPYYEKAGISYLSNDEIADEKFELAYCYFNNKQFDKAEPLFASIKEIKDGKYYKAGNYYYGLLAYNENKFKDALESFDNIQTDKQYHAIVPYYIAETYYFMGNKTQAYQETLDIINNKSDKSFYDNELHLLAAQCLFEDEKYKDAKEYFDYYYEHTDKIRKEDLYKMAYCSYRNNDWISSIEKFKLLSNAHDSLGQTSMYLLGDCYLKTFDNSSARNAFGLCADLNFNKGQQEASMMLYSMISYELGYDDESVRQLKNLLNTFPGTKYRDEANTLLSDLLIKTHNYTEALKYLEKVKTKDDQYRITYQKTTFGYAVQLFRKGDLNESDKYFSLSLLHPSNPYYETAAYFWKGEIAYRLHKYEDAIIQSQEFINRKGENATIERISPLATNQHAYLNMGYSAMALQEFKDAQGYFNHAQQAIHGDEYTSQLASLHEADAVFMQKNYSRAIVLYNKLILTDSDNSDYAKYQKSIILGLQEKTNEKINLLISLIAQSPNSVYATMAKYELAVTYIEDDKYSNALNYLHALTDSVKDKSYASKAWMKIGFVQLQIKDNAKAIEAYKHVLVDYPTSEDRLAALDALKSLYILNNQPEKFAQLLKENKLPSSDSTVVDSAYYSSAELQFSTGNWSAAKTAFESYLKQFPNGIFAIKAHYYRAECNYQLRSYKDALEDYKIILSNTWNDFSENSAIHAATIAYDSKEYLDAFNYFRTLRSNVTNNQSIENSYIGLIKSGYFANKTVESIRYADSLLALPGISAESINLALVFKANSLRLNNKINEALVIYKQLSNSKNGDIAAESRYYTANIYFGKDSVQKAETLANESIRQSAGYDYWIVKSYILLADIMVKQKDYFNAKATLESIVKHTKIADLKQESIDKLEEVKKLEKQKSKLKDE